MSNVIPFGKPRKLSTPAPRPSNDEITLGLLAEMSGRTTQEITVNLCPSFRIEEFLDSRRGHVSNDSIAMAQELLRDSSYEELIAIAEKSNQSEWVARPGYFRVLIDKIRSC